MPLTLRLYDLLPEIYHREDTTGLLKAFLDAIQERFSEVYDREQLVRDAQDIDRSDPRFHQFIAQMLAWELESEHPAEQKFELRYVPELYDLKGTRKGIFLYAWLAFGDYLKDVVALFDRDMTAWLELLHLVSGSGIHRKTKRFIAPPGFPQWSDRHKKFSHTIFLEANRETYSFGLWRPKARRLIERLYFMKAARSTSYLYFNYSEFNDLTLPSAYVKGRPRSLQSMSDLTGMTYLGQRSLGGWPLGRYAPPVHPEITGVFLDRVTTLGAKPLGTWRLGECFHEAHTVLQVR